MPKTTGHIPMRDAPLSPEEQTICDFLEALHEAGHAIVGKHVGHSVHRIHIGEDGGYCEGSFKDTGVNARQKRAIVKLSGQLACAMFGQGMGFDVNNWDNAADDLRAFENLRNGMTFRHARKKAQAILSAKKDELCALARRVAVEKDVLLDPYPSGYDGLVDEGYSS